MSKYITVKQVKDKATGNIVYVYNFVDTESTIEQKVLNNQFKHLVGRLAPSGLRSKYGPELIAKTLDYNKFGLNLPVAYELKNAQQSIDRCNGKEGCNAVCNQQNQCSKLRVHSKLVSQWSYYKEFLIAPIIQG